MVFFFTEIALMEYGMLALCPSLSLVVASTVYAAWCTLKKIPYGPKLSSTTPASVSDSQ
jgi:hypothetical protein